MSAMAGEFAGDPAEARVSIEWIEVRGLQGDGTVYVMRRPVAAFTDEAFGPCGASTGSGS